MKSTPSSQPVPPLDADLSPGDPEVPDLPSPGSSILTARAPAGDRWILTVYLGAVVLPLSLGLWAAAYLRSGEVQRLQFEEHQRRGAAAVFLLDQDLAQISATLARRAGPLPGADRELPDVQAALAGDTVSQVQATPDGMRVSVLLPSGAAGVSFASAPFAPAFLEALGDAVGYDVGLYVTRVRQVATRDDFGPDTLGFGVNRRLPLFPAGMPVRVGDRWASLHPRNPVQGQAAEMAVLVAPMAPRPDPFQNRIPLFSAVVALALGVAGWWLLEYRPAGRPGDRWQGQRSLALVWIPLTMVLVVLTVLAGTFPGEARRATVQELARAMALARTEWERLTPEQLGSLTGFAVTILEGGDVTSTTLPGDDAGAVAATPPPPSAVALTGRLGEGRDEILYMAARLGPDQTLILSAPGPQVRLRGLGLRLAVLGGGLLFLVLIFPVIRSGGAYPRPRTTGDHPISALPGSAPH